MKIKESPKELKELKERFKKHGIAARGFGKPNKKALRKGIEARLSKIQTYNAQIEERLQKVDWMLQKNNRDFKEIEKLYSQVDALFEELGV